MGVVIHDLRAISGVWSCLLSLGGELFNARLWRCDHVAFMEVAGTTRGSRWITDVRGIDRDDFCRHSAVDSDSICGSQRLRNRWRRWKSKPPQQSESPSPHPNQAQPPPS